MYSNVAFKASFAKSPVGRASNMYFAVTQHISASLMPVIELQTLLPRYIALLGELVSFLSVTAIIQRQTHDQRDCTGKHFATCKEIDILE